MCVSRDCFLQFLITAPASCDYRSGLERFKKGDFAGALSDFREAAATDDTAGAADVIREISQTPRSEAVRQRYSAQLLSALGVAAELAAPDVQWELSRAWMRWASDLPEAHREQVRCLTRAAEGGHAEAAWALSRLPISSVAAANVDRFHWLRRVVDLGHVQAQREMVLAPQSSYDDRIRAAKALADRADPFGFAWLGYFYARRRPAERDYRQSAAWLRKAWDAGFGGIPFPKRSCRFTTRSTSRPRRKRSMNGEKRRACASSWIEPAEHQAMTRRWSDIDACDL